MNERTPSDRNAVLSTLDGIRTTSRRPALWARRAVVTVLAAVVGVAALGWLGVHSATATAGADGYTVTVTYARVARAGWDVPLRIRIEAPEPLAGKQITVTVGREYLALFETQGLWPEPADETGDLDTVRWEFDGPDEGSDLTIDYDAYIEPNAQVGTGTTIEVDIDEQTTVAVPIDTLLLP
jgi:hypothetical protein